MIPDVVVVFGVVTLGSFRINSMTDISLQDWWLFARSQMLGPSIAEKRAC